MLLGSTPAPPLSSVSTRQLVSSLNPLRQPRAAVRPLLNASASLSSNRTHLSNLERVLQKHPAAPLVPVDDHRATADASPPPTGGGGLLSTLLDVPTYLFPSSKTAAALEDMSPMSLTHLQRILTDPTDGSSPRSSIAPRWSLYHGANDWDGLLDPLDENLRREVIRYGDFVQAAYEAYYSVDPDVTPLDHHRHVPLPDRSYQVTRSLYATSSVELPRWAPAWTRQPRSSWIGYVAVCKSQREIQRMGRRDIVIALRGTATFLEWAENLRAGLVPMTTSSDRSSEESEHRTTPKVECGFSSLFKTAGEHIPSLSAAVVCEVRHLMERYKGEQLSITVTGHSLGAALAVLAADELGSELSSSPNAPPIAVFSFGGPRVGDRHFADRVEKSGVKVLRVVNTDDVVTKVPLGVLPPYVNLLGGGNIAGYAHVGTELRVDSRLSPYLRPNPDPACCHDLEAYLHLVDGYLSGGSPFRPNAKRSLVRLLHQQGSNVKKVYMSKAQALGLQQFRPAADAVVAPTSATVAWPAQQPPEHVDIQ